MAGRTPAQVEDGVSCVDVLNVSVLKVVGGVGIVEALDGRRSLASLVLDADGVFQAVGSEDVLLVARSCVAFWGRGQGDAAMGRTGGRR